MLYLIMRDISSRIPFIFVRFFFRIFPRAPFFSKVISTIVHKKMSAKTLKLRQAAYIYYILLYTFFYQSILISIIVKKLCNCTYYFFTYGE